MDGFEMFLDLKGNKYFTNLIYQIINDLTDLDMFINFIL